jgi:hypothetical protein
MLLFLEEVVSTLECRGCEAGRSPTELEARIPKVRCRQHCIDQRTQMRRRRPARCNGLFDALEKPRLVHCQTPELNRWSGIARRRIAAFSR